MCKEMKLIKIHKLSFSLADNDNKINSKQNHISIHSNNDYLLYNVDEKFSRYGNEMVNAIIKNIKDDEIDSLDNIKFLYRYPNISLSRDRVALYCQDNDLRVIRNKHSADVRIISKKFIEKLITYSWSGNYAAVSKSIDIVKKHPNAFNSKECQLECINMLGKLPKDEVIDVSAITRRYYYSDNWEKTVAPMLDDFKNCKSHSSNWTILADNIGLYNEIINGAFKWMLDDNCNKIMSAESVALDDESFIQIKNMLKNGVTDDKNVAMSLMANCDIEKSKTYLAMLFFHFGEKMKGTKPWNTVSFKSLRKSFQKYYDNTNYNYGSAHRYQKLIEMLVDDDALTLPAMQHCLDLLFESVIKKATGLSSCDAFQIERSSIRLSDKFADKVKTKSLSQVIKEETCMHNDDLPF